MKNEAEAQNRLLLNIQFSCDRHAWLSRGEKAIFFLLGETARRRRLYTLAPRRVQQGDVAVHVGAKGRLTSQPAYPPMGVTAICVSLFLLAAKTLKRRALANEHETGELRWDLR